MFPIIIQLLLNLCFHVFSKWKMQWPGVNIGVVGGSATYRPVQVFSDIYRSSRSSRCQLASCPHKYRDDQPVDTHADSLMNVSPLHPPVSLLSSPLLLPSFFASSPLVT